jgi:simple sugar transport system ATP-binding protein
VQTFLALRGISKRFGGVQALNNVDLTIAEGEIHCLVGENGSGKSTLIKILAGVEAPDPDGEITGGGHSRAALTPGESHALGIQVIYQDLSLFPNLTVAENIAVSLHLGRPHRVRPARLREVASAAMRRLDVALDLESRVADLPISGCQLVAICRAIVADARLVIMDEPTASLTHHEVQALIRITLELKRSGVAVIFVSHRLEEVMEIADRVSVLRDGRLVGTFDAAEMTGNRLGFLMTGRAFEYQPVRPAPPSETVLSVVGLTRAGEYRDVTFDIRAGEIVGLIGRLGAGRTELALSLFGITRPDAGEIRLHGERLRLSSNRDAITHGMVYVPEDRLGYGLVLDQPIAKNIILTVLRRLARFGLIPPAARRGVVEEWIRSLTIRAGHPEDAVRTLSGGNQQRVVLAKWLARNPAVLILDSPTVGVDIKAKDSIYDIVTGLAARGKAVLMISDEVAEVYYHTNRVLLMQDGCIINEFVPGQTSERRIAQALYA